MSDASSVLFKHRFRGFLPVVVDLETGGFNASTDGILEIAATFFELDDAGQLSVSHTIARNVDPFEGANLEPSALEFRDRSGKPATRSSARGNRAGRYLW